MGLAVTPLVGMAAGNDAALVVALAARRPRRGQVTVALVVSGLCEANIHFGLLDIVAKAFIDEARARAGLLSVEVPSGRPRRQSPTLYGAIAAAWDVLWAPSEIPEPSSFEARVLPAIARATKDTHTFLLYHVLGVAA